HDPVTFTARVKPALADAAYQLDQSLGLFQYNNSYYQGAWGHNEKWLVGTGNQWYFLLEDGQLRKWLGSMDATLQDAGLVASLDASYFADPSLLWNAPLALSPAVGF